jgi:hypothetical protein
MLMCLKRLRKITQENFGFPKAQMNALDDIPQSQSHQRIPKLDQPKYIIETWDHEFVDSEMIMLPSRVYAFYEEKWHVMMDYPFVPFHIKASNTRHVELQNVTWALMDQP